MIILQIILILAILILSTSKNSLSHVGVDPKITFKDAFDVPSNTDGTEQINSAVEKDVPKLNPEEATFQKIETGLAKAANAAICVKFSKETVGEIDKRYSRPENCTYLKLSRVKEVYHA